MNVDPGGMSRKSKSKLERRAGTTYFCGVESNCVNAIRFRSKSPSISERSILRWQPLLKKTGIPGLQAGEGSPSFGTCASHKQCKDRERIFCRSVPRHGERISDGRDAMVKTERTPGLASSRFPHEFCFPVPPSFLSHAQPKGWSLPLAGHQSSCP